MPIRRGLRRAVRAAGALRSDDAVPLRPDPFRSRRDPDGPIIVPYPLLNPVQAIGGSGRVTLLMPGLEMARMTGGPNTALNLVARLAEHGVRLRFVASLAPLDPDVAPIRAHIEQLAGRPLPDLELVPAGRAIPLDVAPDDVFVATFWPTAHIAERARRLTRASAFLYLIQDYEPGFYPFSTSHAMAAATYSLPIRAIFNEHLVLDYFVDQRIGRFGEPAARSTFTSFEPAVDRALFRPEGRAGDHRRRMLFYGRPRNERNCFDLGLRALRLAVEEGAFEPGEWDVVSIGAEIPELDLGHGRVLRPAPWMTYADYAAFITESDLMLSLMLSPHTSYPPLEMAATAGRVVTNVFSSKSAVALSRISPNIDAVEPVPEVVAAALVQAERAVAQGPGAARARFGMPGSWDEAFRDTVPWMIDAIADVSGR